LVPGSKIEPVYCLYFLANFSCSGVHFIFELTFNSSCLSLSLALTLLTVGFLLAEVLTGSEEL
jgi:hypothetical protein